MGNTFGVAGVAKGVWQPQAALFGMVLYSDKDSYVGFLSAFNFALSENVLFSTQMYQARFNENPYYVGSQGDNDSSVRVHKAQDLNLDLGRDGRTDRRQTDDGWNPKIHAPDHSHAGITSRT